LKFPRKTVLKRKKPTQIPQTDLYWFSYKQGHIFLATHLQTVTLIEKIFMTPVFHIFRLQR
jgi:hypothetical protein